MDAGRGRSNERRGGQHHESPVTPRIERRATAGRTAIALVAWGLVGIGFAGVVAPVDAQVPRDERNCITTFNKSIRKVTKTHGKIVKKCLKNFAAGRLTAATPEACIAADPGTKLEDTIDRELDKIDRKCSDVSPAFGVSQADLALVRAVLTQFDLAHGSIGPDLDQNLIPVAVDARCQAKVGAALLKCEDARLREYLKCQKLALKSGQATDAATLAATCLGTGNNLQPDDKGRIALKCGTKIASAINQSCSETNLAQAFASCNTLDPNVLANCLNSEAACQVCRLLNDADGLLRDCDAFDDGNDLNGSCSAECGDGLLQTGEGCDDNNGASNDGCSDFCQVEGGWTCTGEPSVCTLNCGNGLLDAGEGCDDEGTAGGDGCSAVCEVESGWTCTGEPSVCTPNCGNGTIDTGEGEVCDDGDADDGDGCSGSCQVEEGWICSGEPSVCTFECGNGTFQAGETCDDGDADGGDGCSAVCKIEPGWLCSGQPSLCTPVCGDGLVRGNEACDDGDATSGDGCSFSCQVEFGYSCAATEPSLCSAICGDGVIRGAETCDDKNNVDGDGCSGTLCLQEFDYDCGGQPSVCVALCGNGVLNGIEECDDGNNMDSDGCAANCKSEAGYACFGQPSSCVLTCGNSVINSGEDCDDGNIAADDGCSASCKVEPGWFCNTPGAACVKFDVFIDTPDHGTFTTGSSISISGHYTGLPMGQVSVKVNGVNASSLNQTARTFSHTVSLSQAQIFNPVLVTLTNTATGDFVRDRIVIIAGQSVLDGNYSPQSVALRLNDTGLDSLEPLVASLASGQINLGALLPAGTVITDECFINVIGCLGSARVTIANPPPSYSSLNLLMDSQINSVYGDIGIFNLRIDVNIDGSGLVPDCGLRLTANALHLTGNYALQPSAADPTNVDVNLITNPIGVTFNGFNHQFTSGLCDAPIIGDIIQALLPDIEALTTNGIRGFLSDPDGGGPADSPIADSIEAVLAGISITGPVGEGLGVMLDTPLFTVAEDNAGITLGSDSRFTVSIGTGPGQCEPLPGSPSLIRSYSKSEVFPTFGANTPVGNLPYGLGICISSAGFNQLLRAQTECGLMIASLSSIDLDGGGPLPPVAITSSILSGIIPEFGQLPGGTPLRIDITPTLAPIVTGNNGANGELTELKLAQIRLDIVEPGPETVWLTGALDARLGMDMFFDGSGLGISIGTPSPSDLTITIIHNPLGVNEAQVETVLPSILTPLIPDLTGALSGFPLPEFFGLELSGVEVSRNGQFLSLFANLTPAP